MREKLKKFWPLIYIVVVFIVGIIVGGATREGGFKFDAEMIINTATLVTFGIFYGVFIVYWLAKVVKIDNKNHL